MDKRATEAFKAHRTRKALREARFLVKMRVFWNTIHVVRAPELTPNERDRYTQRRIEHDAAMRERAAQVFGRKKKLPLPVFSCENERYHESDLINGETDQVRPRVLGERAK